MPVNQKLPRPLDVLEYWRRSLVDEAQATLSFEGKEVVTLCVEDLRRGILPPRDIKALHALRLKQKDDAEDKHSDVIIASVALRTLNLTVTHGAGDLRHARAYVQGVVVAVSTTGQLSVHEGLPPWINRHYLEPTDSIVTIGHVERMDAWLQANPPDCTEWSRWLDWADRCWDAVTDGVVPQGWVLTETVPALPVVSSANMAMIRNLKKFYDAACADPDSIMSPLLARYITPLNDAELVDRAFREEMSKAPRGSMNGKYGLSPNQSDTVGAYLALEEGEMLAVNGPPGTGKTTLLQGIIATELVYRALRNEEPAVFVCTSTNNQAVQNIIVAMGSALIDPSDRNWARRWVNGADSLGLLFISKERAPRAEKEGFLVAIPGRRPASEDWSGFPTRERDCAILDQAIVTWMARFHDYREDLQDVQDVGKAVEILRIEMAHLHNRVRPLIAAYQRCDQLTSEGPDATALAEKEAELVRLKRQLDEKAGNISARLEEETSALAAAHRHYSTESQNEGRLLTRAEDTVEKQRQQVKDTETFAASLIASLPGEGGIFGGLFSKRKWEATEVMVAQSPHAAAFVSAMQARTRSAYLDVMAGLQETARKALNDAEAELAAVERTRQARLARLGLEIEECANKKIVSESELRRINEMKAHSCDAPMLELISKRAELAALPRMLAEAGHCVGEPDWWYENFEVSEGELPWLWETSDHRALDALLDRTVRFKLFHLALRYWEGRWILETQKFQAALSGGDTRAYPFKGAGEKALVAMYRRWAMLTPCFVSTTATLPKHFIRTARVDQKWQSLYMTGFIDTLIIDEAGQIPPFQAAPAMALAKRAVVVGDIFQIAPVVTMPHSTDCGNAQATGVYQSWWDEDHAVTNGRVVTASARNELPGSVMRVVQSSTRYSSPDAPLPGMFLSEHRRCHRDIIQICNELVYAGRLEPMTAQPKTPPPVPALAWANVSGRYERLGGSGANKKEAAAIARWIGAHAQEWVNHYGCELSKIVAVVTPFSAQKRVLQAIVSHMRDNEKLDFSNITVGTVHALQGAERPIVIFSPTYDRDTPPTFIEGSRSLLNVAISRAKDSFVIIGAMEHFEGIPSSTLGIVGRSMFTRGSELREVTGNYAAPDDIVLRGERLSTHAAHVNAFDTALSELPPGSNAVVVSPFLGADPVETEALQGVISGAIARRCSVHIVTRPAARPADSRLQVLLREMGATLHHIALLHSKSLITPTVLIEGSFNWLSVKRANPEGANLDTSWRLTGLPARAAAAEAIKELRARGAAVNVVMTGEACVPVDNVPDKGNAEAPRRPLEHRSASLPGSSDLIQKNAVSGNERKLVK